MAFTPKNWFDAPSENTPISAAALEDMEARLAAYADSLSSPSITPPVTFTAPTAGVIPLTLKGASSQTADLFRVLEAGNAQRLGLDGSGLTFRHTAPNSFGSTAFRVQGDSQDRVVIGSTGVSLGSGAAAQDVAFTRAGTGLARINGNVQASLAADGIDVLKVIDGIGYTRAGTGFLPLASADMLAAIDEFTESQWHPGTLSVNRRVKMFVAQFPLKIVSASVSNTNAIATSNSNYINVQLYKYWGADPGGHAIIAEKNTTVTTGEAFVANQEWSFAGETFDNLGPTTPGWLLPGDTVQFNVAPFVPATNLEDPVFTVRYEPV